MNRDRGKFAGGTLYTDSRPLHKTQHVQIAFCIVRHRLGKPRAARLQKLRAIEACPLLAPPIAGCNFFCPIQQFPFHPLRVSVPLDISQAMLKMDRAWTAIQSETAPIPKFEGEDVGRSADLKYQIVAAGTVNRPCRDREMIVFAGRPEIHIAFGGKRRSACLGICQVFTHLLAIRSCANPQVDLRIAALIENVVALVLSIRNSEMFSDILAQGMHLQREIGTADRVQEIKADGKFRTKVLVNRLSQ